MTEAGPGQIGSFIYQNHQTGLQLNCGDSRFSIIYHYKNYLWVFDCL